MDRQVQYDEEIRDSGRGMLPELERRVGREGWILRSKFA